MTGFTKYFAKLFILYIVVTNTMPPTAFASELLGTDLTKPMVNEVSTPAPDPTQNIEPVVALPVSSHKFSVADSVLGLATNDAPQMSAKKRLGVLVEKLQKHDYKASDDITLTLDNPDQEKYKAIITDATGKDAQVQVQQVVQNGTTQLQVIPTNQFKPGKYTISITDQDGKTTKQDFTWGVLTLNADKAIYAPNQNADFSMAVLDDKGSMVCDASVNLTITNEATGTQDTLSTDNKKIIVNSECSSHAFTLRPDYEAHYQLGGVGTYNLTLTAQTSNGSHTITDQISVQQATAFDIQRSSSTRIYPPNSYPMQINVTANKDFNGTITETVPDSFAITPATNATSYDAMRTVYLENKQDPSQTLAKNLDTSASGLVMPFDGNYPITQGFGSQLTDPTLQALYTKFGLAGHDGIDFGIPMGTRLYAVDDGKIMWAGPGDYGTQVIIKHSWGQTYYGHMSKTSVAVGDDVKKGSLLGYSGMSGEATGPHLHFGMKPTSPDMNNGYSGKIDPLPYLPIGDQAKGINLPKLIGLPAVLGASTSAAASASGADLIPTPTITGAAISTPQGIATSSATSHNDDTNAASSSAQFTIGDAVSQQSADNQPQSLEKVKVIKWQVKLKKGDNISLSYNFKTPQISPQFYLIGSLKFFTTGTTGESKQIFDEGRQWQIAADDIGTGWYHSSASPYVGYEWPYRKKLTIDHTKVGMLTPTFDTSNTTAKTTSSSTINCNLSVGNSSNRLLLVAVNENTTVSTVTVNNTNGTNIPFMKINNIKFNASNNVELELWYLVNPATGTNNITVNLSASSQAIIVGASSYYNVNQTTPLGIQNTMNGHSTAPSVTVTSNTNQLVVDAVSNFNGGTFTVGGGQTQEWQKVPGGSFGTVASSDEPGGAVTTTMSWTTATDDWGDIAVPVNGSQSNETNFPVLVSLTDTDLKTHAQNSGNDILFTDSTGQTKIPSEVESYNSTTGALVAWVQVSSLSSSADTDIYMYYGNGSVGSQSTPTSVWDSNYKSVWHSSESSGTTLNDSTSNGFDGAKQTASRPNPTTGQIAGAQSYNATTSDYVNISSTASSIQSGNFSFSAWVKFSSTFTAGAAADEEVFGLLNGSSNNNSELYFRTDTGKLEFSMVNGTPALVNITTAQTSWTGGTWYYITATYSSSNGMVLYINGLPVGTNSSSTRDGSPFSNKFFLGSGFQSGSPSFFFNGVIDEARVSSTARSADWIATEYANQSSPGTFIPTIGSEETKIYAAPMSALMRHGKFFDTSANNYGKQPFLF